MSAGKLLTEQFNKMPGLSSHCTGLALQHFSRLQIYKNLELLRPWFDPGATYFFFSFNCPFRYSDRRRRLKKELTWVESSQT